MPTPYRAHRAQSLDGESVLKVQTLAQQALFSTLRIETPNSVGTGAIVNHEWGPGHMGPFLVTNKHVIKEADKVTLTFTSGEGIGASRRPILGNSWQFSIVCDSQTWTGHPTSSVDVAAMPLASIHDALREKGGNVYYRGISTDLVPGESAGRELDAVEEILFVGYPSNIYDKKNNLPIVRKGITATPYAVDYEGYPIFLIDASVFPGSSGSPVFLYDVGSPVQRFQWLGLLGSVYYREEEGTLRFREVPADLRPVFETKEMIDLGIVYKSHAVVETIEHLLHVRGAMPGFKAETEATP